MVIRLVSDQSEQQHKRSIAEQRVEASLRACAANLLRVVAGAGRPEELPGEMAAFVQAFQAMQEAGARERANVIMAESLNVEADALRQVEAQPSDVQEAWSTSGQLERLYARERIRKAALRLSAAEIVGQLNHRNAAHAEIHRGVADYMEARKSIQRANAGQVASAGSTAGPRGEESEADTGYVPPSSPTAPSI